MSKTLWFDCETTGLNAVKNDIIQIAFIVEMDGIVLEKREFKTQPCSYDYISPEALKVHGMSLETINGFPQPNTTFKEIVFFLDKHIDKYSKADKFYPAGFNVQFDIGFLKQFFIKNGHKYFGSYFNYKPIDPQILVNLFEYEGKLKLPNYKLITLCKHFKIELKAHDAMCDIVATRELWNLLRSKVRFENV